MAKAAKSAPPVDDRIGVVFIRKSTGAQNEQAQKDNVLAQLKRLNKPVPEPPHWFAGVVKRRMVGDNDQFKKMMELVQAGKVATIYVEAQDRFGTTSRVDLFKWIGVLRDHDTALVDLRTGNNIAATDKTSEFTAILNSMKSEDEVKDLSQRVMRTKVENFRKTGTLLSGLHPFGYGKACYTQDGRLRWEWQPETRTRGQLYETNAKGKLVPVGLPDRRTPVGEKGNRDRRVLIPSRNKRRIATVKLVFELFTKAGLSRRAISARLNAEGHKFYDKPFTFSLVSQILENRAYVGDLHYGKTQSGLYNAINEKGEVVEAKVDRGRLGKPVKRTDAPLTYDNAHTGLIDRKTWNAALARLADEEKRTSVASRNSAYYLKPIFVCGHCGKNVTGRTEIDPSSKERKVVYVCSSYITGKSNGQESKCGYHRIAHDDAERLLLDKIKELDLEFNQFKAELAVKSVEDRVTQLRGKDAAVDKQIEQQFTQGIDAFRRYLAENGFKGKRLDRVLGQIRCFYIGMRPKSFKQDFPVTVAKFYKLIKDFEAEEVAEASRRMAELDADHEKLTLSWARANLEMQTTLRKEIDKIEAERQELEPRTMPLSKRIVRLEQTQDEMYEQRQRLLAELPHLEAHERGEAFRRLFKTVTLFWSSEFRAALAVPSRPRTTERPGRNRYTLETSKIGWELVTPILRGFT